MKKFNYYTFYKSNVQIVPANLGIVFPGYLATTKERRNIFPLKTFTQGEEVTVLDITIQPNDDYSLNADKVLVQVSYDNQTLNIPLPVFETLFIAEDLKDGHPLPSTYPKNFKYCDPKISEKKNYTLIDMKSNYEELKENIPSLKDMGELYLDNNGTYCFETSVTNLASEISLVMNQSFIFQARPGSNE